MKTKTPYLEALNIANAVKDFLYPYCKRIEIAGSIRRESPEIGDIEIVATPMHTLDMFGERIPLEKDHSLNYVDYSKIGVLKSNGAKMKKVQLDAGMQLDLFIVTPPAQWGVLFLIRTGPAEYSHRFVTKLAHGGMLPFYMRVHDGALYQNEKLIETPEEEDVYKAIGTDYVEPQKRGAKR